MSCLGVFQNVRNIIHVAVPIDHPVVGSHKAKIGFFLDIKSYQTEGLFPTQLHHQFSKINNSIWREENWIMLMGSISSKWKYFSVIKCNCLVQKLRQHKVVHFKWVALGRACYQKAYTKRKNSGVGWLYIVCIIAN